jgi:hypothetical protein
MPAIHGNLSDKRFVAFHNQCNLYGVEASGLVSTLAELAMDDQEILRSAVNRIKNNKKEVNKP